MDKKYLNLTIFILRRQLKNNKRPVRIFLNRRWTHELEWYFNDLFF